MSGTCPYGGPSTNDPFIEPPYSGREACLVGANVALRAEVKALEARLRKYQDWEADDLARRKEQ